MLLVVFTDDNDDASTGPPLLRWVTTAGGDLFAGESGESGGGGEVGECGGDQWPVIFNSEWILCGLWW